MRTYGQYCPIARAAEILTERWTAIIVRNLMAGCTTFSEISAGAPGLSHSLLTQRLRLLERVGIVISRPKPSGHGRIYELTASGRDLQPVLWALRDWGEKWLELGDEHTNPALVLWAWCTAYLAHERLPDHRVLVRFDFTDQPSLTRHLWLLVEDRDAEVCKHHPGFDEDLVVETDTRTFALWHMKHLEWADALRAGRIRFSGSRSLASALPTWNRRGFEGEDAHRAARVP
jgi:DNA-binding HxlR family transcriptional regulator